MAVLVLPMKDNIKKCKLALDFSKASAFYPKQIRSESEIDPKFCSIWNPPFPINFNPNLRFFLPIPQSFRKEYIHFHTLGSEFLKAVVVINLVLAHSNKYVSELESMRQKIVSDKSAVTSLAQEKEPIFNLFRSIDEEFCRPLEVTASCNPFRKSLWGLNSLLIGLDLFSELNQWSTSPEGSTFCKSYEIEQVKLSKEQEALESTIGYKFKTPSLLVRALQRWTQDPKEDNKFSLLEWIGDALIECWLGETLVKHRADVSCEPEVHPERRDRRNAKITSQTPRTATSEAVFRKYVHVQTLSNPSLAEIAYHILRLHNNLIEDDGEFVQVTLEDLATGEEGKERYKYKLKRMADSVEALIGAIYVDCKFTFHGALFGVCDQIFEGSVELIKKRDGKRTFFAN